MTFTVLMFSGTLLSSFSLYYSYQTKKEFSKIVTSTPNVQENIESNSEVDIRIEIIEEPMEHVCKLAPKEFENEDIKQ